MNSPALLTGEMNDQHVVGIQMAAIGLVATLRKENRRVGKRRGTGVVERRGQRIDLGFEDVEPFENASHPVLQMLLQHVEVDEFDPSLLDRLVDARARQVHGLAGLKKIQVVEIDQWIVEVAAQIGLSRWWRKCSIENNC